MHTAHHQELPQGGDDSYTEPAGGHTEPGKAAADGVAHNSAQRRQQAEDKGHGNEQAEERSENGGQQIGHELFDDLIDQAEQGHRQHNGQNSLGVIGHSGRDAKDCERLPVGGKNCEIGHHQNAANERTQHTVDPQLLGCIVAYQDGHEVKSCVIQEIKQDVQVAFHRVQAQQVGAKDGINGTEQASGQQHRDHGGHTARQITHDIFEHLLERQLLPGNGGILSGRIILDGGAGADACQLAQFLIHFRNIGADHDLVLLAAAHNTQHTGNLFHLIVFGEAVVFQIQTQACHAMGGILEIGRSTYRRQNLLGDLFIVCHTDSSYFKSNHRK